jgi:hypothetical protein
MSSFHLHYADRTEVRIGDRVSAFGKKAPATVTILLPGSQDASDHALPEGGLLVEFDDGDVYACPHPDEDMEKIIP